ncbi:MAG: DUF5916 domain-containing protein, partial [Promethearchaeota archaeon]
MIKKIIFFITSIFLLYPTTITSQTKEKFIIPRLSGTIELDGKADEDAWQKIEPISLIMFTPHFMGNPTEKSTFKIAHDDNFVYVAGYLYDSEPDKIQAPVLTRDNMGGFNDWFGVIFDTYNDKENALTFFTNPEGIRTDFTVYNDAQGEFPFKPSWNTFWDVEVTRNNQGWFAEIKIPLTSLRFQDKDGKVVMGLIAWRLIARKNEFQVFPTIPNKWGFWSVFKPSQAQEILLENIKSKNPIYITPYGLGGYGLTSKLNDDETLYDITRDFTKALGLDIKYGLTSNLTMDLTYNTDFAQVEADDQQVNLTRFSLFFPEKRLFFQERSSIFEFNTGGPNRLFYSRRIGIDEDGNPVDIYGGVRIVGRTGKWDLGILDMQTKKSIELPSENFGVLRFRRQAFNENSYLGGMITSRIGMDGNKNIAYGLDGTIRPFGDEYISISLVQTLENDQKFSLRSALLRTNWEKRR